LTFFNEVSGKSFVIFELFDPWIVLLLLLVTILSGILAGLYPAIVLAATSPSSVLKSAQKSGTGGQGLLRKVLIVSQFAISIFLVIGTMVVYEQMKYAREQNFGLDREQVLVVQLTDPAPMNLYRSYKNEILNHPDVISVSASFSAPASLVQQSRIRLVNTGSDETWQVQTYFSDFDFIETLGMELIEGRTIIPDNPGDTLRGIMVNETAVKSFGWGSNEEAIGQEIQFAGNSNNNWKVVGVIGDFQSLSVRERIPPTIIGYFRFGFFAFVRVRLDNISQTVNSLSKTWGEIVPGYTFDYSFLDDDFDKLYNGEAVLNKLLTFFAGLAIFIACLGLLGLTSFLTEQRAKEIGIRKVMGSSVQNVVFLLSKDFTKLVIFGFMISAPLAYYIMDDWLNGFAYHIKVSPVIFVIAIVASLIAAWITVSFQTIKAASINPVKSLRNE